MVKKISLQPHLSEPELKRRYRSTKDPIEARRYHLLWLVSQGYLLTEAAAVVGLSYDYARKVVRRYNVQGVESIHNGLKQKRGARSDALLNVQQRQKLKEQLQAPPDDGGHWTGPKVARWIERETGRKKVWDQRGWDYIKQLGFSLSRSRFPQAKDGAFTSPERATCQRTSE